VSLLYSRQQSFRAVLLHEMAHWSLGDVPTTYFTTSIWFTFARGALLPGAAGLGSQDRHSAHGLQGKWSKANTRAFSWRSIYSISPRSIH